MNLKFMIGKAIRKFLLIPTLKACEIDKTCKIGSLCALNRTTVGKWSYIGDNTNITYADIGKFTSISSNCSIGGGEHPVSWVSTSPVFTNHKSVLRKCFAPNEFNPYKKVKIGNDVWIGTHVCIKSGVTISDGAIIGMGAVVTKNVGPYEIWVGNPARLIRKRFSEEDIAYLLRISWWNWESDYLIKIGNAFTDIESLKKEVTR